MVWGGGPHKVSTAVRAYEDIERIDAFCDAVPRRRARAQEYGPLVLFVPTGPGWPYYARPRRGAAAAGHRRRRPRGPRPPARADHPRVLRVDRADRARHGGGRGRGGPGGPDPPAHGAGRASAGAVRPAGITVRVVAPEEPELDRIWAVPAVAFGHPGTATGEAGPAERDKIAADHDGGTIAMLRERLRSGQSVLAAAFGPDGPVAAGSCQAVGGVAEITGVGVLPSARRQGLGAAITALLAGDALDRGVETVFLSASDDTVARVYARIGFRQIGIAMIAEPAPD